MTNIGDKLSNVISGLGTKSDARTGRKYAAPFLSQQDVDAAYRGSGLMRKIIDIPANDTVREWREWSGGDAEKVEAEEKRLKVRQKIREAEVLRGLGGGAMFIGAPGEPSEPLLDDIGPGNLVYLHLVSRWHINLGPLVENTESEMFGEPEYFEITATTGTLRFHPSRVICFKGQAVPDLLHRNQQEAFWGESRIVSIEDAVLNSDNAQAAFSALIDKARNTEIGIPGLSEKVATTEGEQALIKRISVMMQGESMFNAKLYDSGQGRDDPGEEINHHQVTWAGIPAIMFAFAEYVSAVSDIPMTRLFGRAPEGLNSSGESQQKDWNKKIRAHQELELAPCLEVLDKALIASAGASAENISWEFAPLDIPSQKEESERFKTTMEAVDKLLSTASIPEEALNAGVQGLLTTNNWLPGLKEALDNIPEDERLGVSQTREADLGDALPRTLYVSRRVINADDLKEWAKSQGFELQDDLHVTTTFSRKAFDWTSVDHSDWNEDDDAHVTIKPGGVRIVEPLGDKTAVLLFTSSMLTWRHEEIKRAGASHDFPEYQPHISLSEEPIDLDAIEPYQGEIILGPERFEELKL